MTDLRVPPLGPAPRERAHELVRRLWRGSYVRWAMKKYNPITRTYRWFAAGTKVRGE